MIPAAPPGGAVQSVNDPPDRFVKALGPGRAENNTFQSPSSLASRPISSSARRRWRGHRLAMIELCLPVDEGADVASHPSAFSATTGSILAARQAGIAAENSATADSPTAAAMNTLTSVALTATSMAAS